MMCAGGDGCKHADVRDIGYPRIVEKDSEPVLVGVMSWAVQRPQPSIPAASARLSKAFKCINHGLGGLA
jgi:hypothetical protein